MISAVVLAAGRSTRMQRPKLTLPWGNSTVIGHIMAILMEAGVDDLLLVTGDNEDEIRKNLTEYRVRYVKNPDYKNGEMMTSVKVGLMNLGHTTEAALIVLGDQPQIEEAVVRQLIDTFIPTHGMIVIPSYQMRRGHPLLIDGRYWDEILNLNPPDTLRDFLSLHQDQIVYVDTNSPTVIQDMDTPEDYIRYQP